MKKIAMLVGGGAGFVLGSKMGTGPYEQLEARVRQILGRPEVQGAVEQVKSTAKDQAGAITDKVGTKLPSPGDGSSAATTPLTPSV